MRDFSPLGIQPPQGVALEGGPALSGVMEKRVRDLK